MHRPAPRYPRYIVLGALTLAGCATAPAPARHPESISARFERIRDSLQGPEALDTEAPAEVDASLAPRVSLFIPPAGYTMVNYVDAAFRVTADAYVLVLTVDRDRRVRVLYPESPAQSGFATRRGATHLTRFFGGFGSRASAYASYDLSQRLSPFGSGGVLLAVASDRPLQLQRLADQDGDWDAQQLDQLVFERTLPAATHSVARAVLLTGQEYSTDYLTFNGSRTLNAYGSYASGFAGCGVGGGSSAFDAFDTFGLRGYASAEPFTRLIGFYQRDGHTYARYMSGGGCGTPVYYDVETPRAAPVPVPVDTIRHDSAATTHRWAVARGGQDETRGTPVAAAGIRFRGRGDLPDAAPPTGRPVSRISPRGVGAAHRPPNGADAPMARFHVETSSSPAARTGPVARREPRIERREEARAPVRAEPRAAAHRPEAVNKVTAY